MIEFLFWVFVGSASIQFLFYTIVSIALLFYKKPSQVSEKIPGVSIVISAKNEVDNLKKLIPILLNQKFGSYEIILVDDKSTDETYDYAIELDQKESSFKLVRIDSTPDTSTIKNMR